MESNTEYNLALNQVKLGYRSLAKRDKKPFWEAMLLVGQYSTYEEFRRKLMGIDRFSSEELKFATDKLAIKR